MNDAGTQPIGDPAPAAPGERRVPGVPVAVIGIAGFYPGSLDHAAFLAALADHATFFRPIPASHLPPAAIEGRQGAFLDDVALFDNAFFGIAPLEAAYMDPRQRLLLMACWHALESAGYPPEHLTGARVDVYVAAEGSPYTPVVDRADVSPHTAPGISSWALPNRISHHFGFRGRSLLLDAACTGSLAALHEAMRALRCGEADYAVVAAASLLFGDAAAGAYLGQQSLGILGEQTTCRPFQEDAAGFLPGEGAVAVLLRRADEASRDGDVVHARLIGSAIDHSGGEGSFVAPSAAAQARAMAAAVADAGIDPFSVTHFEAHGVSSALADAEEIKAFLRADAEFRRRYPDRPAPTARIGSIKPNIGHANCVSGLMSLVRVLAGLAAGKRLGITGFGASSRHFDLRGSRFLLDGESDPWPCVVDADGTPLPARAGINNFSAGGACAFLLVEAPPPPAPGPSVDSGGPWLLALSAPDADQLPACATALVAFIAATDDLDPGQLEYLFAARRRHFAQRVVFRYRSIADLRDKLQRFIDAGGGRGYSFRGESASDAGVRELFKRYPGLARTLEGMVGEEGRRAAFDLWTRGIEGPLSALFPAHAYPKRVLPVYPFRLRPFWLAPRAAAAQAAPDPHRPEQRPLQRGETSVPHAAVVARLLAAVAQATGLPPAELTADRPLAELAIDSVQVLALNAALAGPFPALSRTLWFECRTLTDMAAHLCAHHSSAAAAWAGVRAGPAALPATAPESLPAGEPAAAEAEGEGTSAIAVIGLAGRYPHAADLDRFWQNLHDGVDCIDEIPAERWPLEDFYAEPASAHGGLRSVGRWGGFIDGFDEFDALLFRISPAEAATIDPQERLFLQACWHALEDGGWSRERILRERCHRVAVFAGLTKTGFELHAPPAWARGEAVLPRTSFSSAANRVSFVFDLHGPSLAVDTMCSASLTAIHLACEHLRAGGSAMALAGGTNLYLHPANYVAMSTAGMLSPDGRCRSFGADANGIVPGEGVGVALLKPLARALADGDPIRGCILATAVNHGGATNGYTVPSPAAQAALVAAAIRAAGIAPDTIGYVEAHGTGTVLGDPIEVEGLRQAFAATAAQPLPPGSCALGSVKSAIGHLEAAAGIAGLTRILLQMENGLLTPTLHAERENPNIDFDATPFRLQRTLAPWRRSPGTHRRAAVSSFGAGGANAHLIVEEAPDIGDGAPTGPGVQLVVLSAASSDQLERQARDLLAWIERRAPDDAALQRIACTLQIGREPMQERLAIVAVDMNALRTALAAYLAAVPRDVESACAAFYRDTARPRDPRRWTHASEVDAARAIAAWVDDARPEPVLKLWLAGTRIDWRAAYRDGLPRRISLPGYPFARERFMVPGLGRMPAVATVAADIKPETAPAAEVVLLGKTWVAALDAAAGHGRERREVVLAGRCVQLGPALRSAASTPAAWHALPMSGDAAADACCALACEAMLDILKSMRVDAAAPVLLQLCAEDDDPGLEACFAGLSGLLKSVARERPGLRVQCVRIAAGTALEHLPEQLAGLAGRSVCDARIEGGALLELQLAPLDAPAGIEGRTSAAWPLRADGVYLISGGFGGIGERVSADILARASGARVIVFGRSALDPDRAARLSALRAAGADIDYVAADVADAAQVEALIARAGADGRLLRGVIHAAGVLRDAPASGLDRAALAAVLAPKTTGTRLLDRATRDAPLDFFACFSSLAGHIGNAGQAGYAAANAFMDAWMAHRERLRRAGERSGASVSIGWPLWADVGMRAPAATLAALRAEGMVPLAPEDGLKTFWRILAGETPPYVGVLARAAKAPDAIAPPAAAAMTRAEVREVAGAALCATLGVRPSQLDGGTPFSHYGLDSISAAIIVQALRRDFQDVPDLLLFQVQTLDELCADLTRRRRARPATEADTQPVLRETPAAETAVAPAAADVAVIAIAGRFPGGDDVEGFWSRLAAGTDAVREVPPDRIGVWGGGLPESADGAPVCRWGAFLDEPFAFDAEFFGIAAGEAMLMEPQERLVLESVWHLFEQAGHPRHWRRQRYRNRIGVYVGASGSQYRALAGDAHAAALAAVNGNGSIANRTSYWYGLEGPSLSVDTLCSSAITALQLACRDLRTGECEAAVVAGVNLALHPDRFIGLSLAGLLASTPDSRSFAAGDGFLPSEAAVCVLLKPLAEARRDGDRVHGVIRAVALNHGGSGAGYTSPNLGAQIALLQETLRRADAGSADIGWIESAANGAPLLDAVEFAALSHVFADAPRPLPVGSVKSWLGHAEAASGLVQLAAVLLQLEHRRQLPCRTPQRPNPALDWEKAPLRLVHEAADWPVDMPRTALITSVGAGGANGCVVVSAAPAHDVPVAPAAPGRDEIVVLSAASPDRLRAVVAATGAALRRAPATILADLAWTLQLRREPLRYRAAYVAADIPALLAAIERWLDDPRNGSAYAEPTTGGTSPDLAADPAAALSAGDYARVAAWWCQGIAVDWSPLHPQPRRLVALPPYPFERRSWLLTSPRPVADADTDPLLALVAGVLACDPHALAREATLDALGMNSIALLTLRHRAEMRCGRALDHALFDRHQPLDTFLSRLAAAAAEPAPATGAPHPVLRPDPAAANQPFPLTDLQEAIWAGRHLQIDKDWVGCHVYCEFEAAALDPWRLDQAWQRLLDHHAMLRARVLPDGRQRVAEPGTMFKLRHIDLRDCDPATCSATLERLRAALSHRVYRTGDRFLFDIALASLPDGSSRVCFSIDEILVDAVSIDRLLAEWQALYLDPARELRHPSVSFRDYVVAVREFESGPAFRAQLDRALAACRDLPSGPRLPRAPAPADADALRRRQYAARIPAARWSALQARLPEWRASATGLLLGLFAATLRSHCDEATFSLSMTLLNRPPLHPDLETLVGPFISTQIAVCEPPEDDSLQALLATTEAMLARTLSHSAVSGVRLLRELKRSRACAADATLPIVFTSMLNVAGAAGDATAPALFRPLFKATQTPQVFLDCQVLEQDGDLHIVWDVAEGVYAPDLAATLFERYREAIETVCGGATDVASPVSDEVPALRIAAAPQQRHAPFPLTVQQQAYGYARSSALAGGAQSCQFYCELAFASLDVEALEQAWNRLMHRHPQLTTRILPNGTQQAMPEWPPYRIETEDLGDSRPAAREAALARGRAALQARVVPLDGWPFFAIEAVRLDGGSGRVRFAIDMIVADGASIQRLLEEWVSLYREPARELAPLSLTFRDYVMAVQAYAGTPPHAADLAYWRGKFAVCRGGPRLPRASAPAGHGHRRLSASFPHWGALVRAAGERGLPVAAVLLAAYLEVLAEAAGDQRFEVVVPGWRRPRVHADIDAVIGDFTTMAWIAREPGEATLLARSRHCAAQLRDDARHGLVNGVSVLRRGHGLAYPVVFSEPQTAADGAAAGASAQGIEICAMGSKTGGVDLDNITDVHGDAARLHWDHAEATLDGAAVEAWFERYRTLLMALACDRTAWERTTHIPQFSASDA